MTQFEVHTISQYDEDLGTLYLGEGEFAIYDDRKTAQKVANGMNYLRQTKGCGFFRHQYIVVKKEVPKNA